MDISSVMIIKLSSVVALPQQEVVCMIDTDWHCTGHSSRLSPSYQITLANSCCSHHVNDKEAVCIVTTVCSISNRWDLWVRYDCFPEQNWKRHACTYWQFNFFMSVFAVLLIKSTFKKVCTKVCLICWRHMQKWSNFGLKILVCLAHMWKYYS